MTEKQITNFWKKIKITDGCWLWQGAKNSHGYGHLGVKKKTIGAHRIMYQLKKGIISNNLCVLHKCDNPSCVNPEHLELGTHQDNMKDRDNKGRKGKNFGNPKKSIVAFNTINNTYSNFSSVSEASKTLNIPRPNISAVLSKRLTHAANYTFSVMER